MGTLYIVPTPIGNLEDITLRALRILREASLIAAEDTRTSRVLLDHYEIRTPTTSYHEHNKLGKLDAIFDALAVGDVALISDAGTPGISDPGYELVQEAIRRGVPVVPLPGPSAVTAALVASGLPTDSFVYLGFPPRKPRALQEFFAALASEQRTLVFYENPYRVLETLQTALQTLGDRPACVAREISKMFEEFYRGSISGALEHFGQQNPRGEVTVLLGGAPAADLVWDESRVRAALQQKLAQGAALSAAAREVAAVSGWKKKAVYALGLEE